MEIPSYKKLTKTLHNIHDELVSVKQRNKQQTNGHLDAKIEIILDEMIKVDELFASLQPRVQYMDAYFEGIQVHQDTPIPVHLEFRTYIKKINSKSVKMKCRDIYTTLEEASAPPAVSDLGQWSHKQTIDFVKNVTEKSLKSFQKKEAPPPFRIVKRDAENYHLKVGKTRFMFVPIIAFHLNKREDKSGINFENARYLGPEYFLAPPGPADNPKNEFEWVIGFPQQEKRLLKSRYSLKFVLRLIKLLIRAQNIPLSDYCVKCIFLHEIDKQGGNFWILNKKGFLLLHMIKVMIIYFNAGMIPHYWCRSNNFLDGIENEMLNQWSARLTAALAIEKNNNVRKFFQTNTVKKNNLEEFFEESCSV